MATSGPRPAHEVDAPREDPSPPAGASGPPEVQVYHWAFQQGQLTRHCVHSQWVAGGACPPGLHSSRQQYPSPSQQQAPPRPSPSLAASSSVIPRQALSQPTTLTQSVLPGPAPPSLTQARPMCT